MSILVSLAGAVLQAQPGSQGQDQASFPSGALSVPFELVQNPKLANVDTGVMRPNVQSPNAPATMQGVGASPAPVTAGHTLYLRTATQFMVQFITQNPAGGGNITGTALPLMGLCVWEFPPNGQLVGLTLQGAGQVEYYVAGNQ